jgi:hypothetical protein
LNEDHGEDSDLEEWIKFFAPFKAQELKELAQVSLFLTETARWIIAGKQSLSGEPKLVFLHS